MRPHSLDEIVGQRRLTAPDRPCTARWRRAGCIPWCYGAARLRQNDAGAVGGAVRRCRFVAISAVLSGLPEVRKALAEVEANLAQGRRTMLFVDEVYMFRVAVKIWGCRR